MTQRAYKAIFFDLDGTLLPVDMDEFLHGYGKLIAQFFAERGYEDPIATMKAVFTCTHAMTMPHQGSNADAFWAAFVATTGLAREKVEPELMDFYTGLFNKLGEGVAFDGAKQVIDTLKSKGYPLYLTTMPLFPQVAVEQRLSWIGVDANNFNRITHYENSCAAKPSLDYYRESLDAAGVDAADVLMVGNNTVEDLALMELGADAFLVTDMMIDPVGFDLSTVRHGTFDDLIAFVEQLPCCGASLGDSAKNHGVSLNKPATN